VLDRGEELERLARVAEAEGQVAADDHQVGRLAAQVGQHRLERVHVGVDVGQEGEAVGRHAEV